MAATGNVPGLKPARKSKDRPLGFRAGDWMMIPLTSNGFAAAYVSHSGDNFLILHPFPIRFAESPSAEELARLDPDRADVAWRLEPGTIGISSLSRVEDASSLSADWPVPSVYALKFAYYGPPHSYFVYPAGDFNWHSRELSEPPKGDLIGVQMKVNYRAIPDVFDRALPGRVTRYRQGDWFSVKLSKSKWVVGSVLRTGSHGVTLVAFASVLFERQPDAAGIERARAATKFWPMRVWDSELQKGKWPVLSPGTRRDETLLLGQNPHLQLALREGSFTVEFDLADPHTVTAATQVPGAGATQLPPDFLMDAYWVADSLLHSFEYDNVVTRGTSASSEPVLPQSAAKVPKPRKKPFTEGDWYGFPLDSGGYGVARIARHSAQCLLIYLAGSRFAEMPQLHELRDLEPADAYDIRWVAQRAIKQDGWMNLGREPDWDRSRWPMPDALLGMSRSLKLEIEPDPNPAVPIRADGTMAFTPEQARTWPQFGRTYSWDPAPDVDRFLAPLPEFKARWEAKHFPREGRRTRIDPTVVYHDPDVNEGDWFLLRLEKGGWILGRLMVVRGTSVLAYFFGPRIEDPSAPIDLQRRPDERILAILGTVKGWNASNLRFTKNEPIWESHEVLAPTYRRVFYGAPGHRTAFAYSYSLGDLSTIENAHVCELDEIDRFQDEPSNFGWQGVELVLGRWEKDQTAKAAQSPLKFKFRTLWDRKQS